MNIDVAKLTREYGGEWAISHAKRILAMVRVLGGETPCSHEALELAAYLHDWGAYPQWARPGEEHQDVSAEVAGRFLRENGCEEGLVRKVVEIVKCHHGGPADRSVESILFTDADALDLLGAVGTCKVFSMHSRDLRKGCQSARRWRDVSLAAIRTEQGKALAAERARETDAILAAFERESLGFF